jgi:hypothetical protein
MATGVSKETIAELPQQPRSDRERIRVLEDAVLRLEGIIQALIGHGQK